MKFYKNDKVFYGWYIVAIAFIANFMSIGTSFYIVNAFLEPICETRNWSRTDINLALSLGTAFNVFSQFLYGTFVIRIGPRILMLLGSILSGISFILLGHTKELIHFYLFYILLFLGNGAYGGIVANTAVNNWFIIKRGSAMGLAAAGQSLSGVILPFLAMMIINHWELNAAFLWIGVMIISVGPLAWLVVKNWPEDYGLTPDGLSNRRNSQNLKEASTHLELNKSGLLIEASRDKFRVFSWSISTLIRTESFWRIGIAYAFAIMGVVGVMSQLKPHFTSIGFRDITAMGMMATTAFIGTLGKYIWGMLCDRFAIKRVVIVIFILNGFGLIFSLLHHYAFAVALFIIIFGFAMGGIWSTYPIIIAEIFGRESFPSVSRFMSIFLIFQIVGYIIVGQSFDKMGSYIPAYILFILFNFISAILILGGKYSQIKLKASCF